MRLARWMLAAAVVYLVACTPLLSAQALNKKPTSTVTTGMTIDATVIYKGMPYSATKTMTRTTLSGTTSVFVSHICRDAEGRERNEGADLRDKTEPPENETHTINVSDPVANQHYAWNTGKNLIKYATVSQFPAAKHLVEVWPETSLKAKLAALPDQSKPEIIQGAIGSSEALPPKYLHGVFVTGKRITIVLPPGTNGTSQEQRVVTETWISPDLQLAVLRIQSNSATGSLRTELTDISRANPDRSLFEPPADYTQVNLAENSK